MSKAATVNPPPFLHRSRDRNWTPQERLRRAQQTSIEQHRKSIKITLPKAPWVKE